MSPNLWNNNYTLFLFDHQIIYCKRDLLKRSQYLYKGRIFLDNCRILNLPDGKIFGVTLKNTLRLYCDTKNKWYDFSFRSVNSKAKFLNTIKIERDYCGEHLFISELASSSSSPQPQPQQHHQLTSYDDYEKFDDNYSDVEDIDSKLMAVKNENKGAQCTNKTYSDTLPNNSKSRSRKVKKSDLPPPASMSSDTGIYELNTNSLGRKKIGNWFKKSTTKSMNNTPSHSPTRGLSQLVGKPSDSDESTNLLRSSHLSSISSDNILNDVDVKHVVITS